MKERPPFYDTNHIPLSLVCLAERVAVHRCVAEGKVSLALRVRDATSVHGAEDSNDSLVLRCNGLF